MAIDIPAVVREIRTEAERVVSLVLESTTSEPLPAWAPGAHVDLVLGTGLIRQYSLCGDPADRRTYRVAVLEEVDGRGGSRHVHQELQAGTKVILRGPRNQFVLDDVATYLFIAGGIGVTPILPMVAECERRRKEWRVVYCGRSRKSMAFSAELAAYGPERTQFVAEDEVGLPDIHGALLSSGSATERIYVCGPEGLIEAVRSACRQSGIGTNVRYERFTAPAGERDADLAFDVVVASSGQRVRVDPNCSVLDALRAAGLDLPSECEGGLCGTCETGVLAGRVRHRDLLLSDDERASNKRMMICVSRSDDELVLDL